MIIILHGEDSFRSHKKLTEIKEKFVRDVDRSRLNIVMLEKADCTLAKLKHEIHATPFLAKKKLVILKNCFDKKVSAEIIALLEAQTENKEGPIIVIYQDKNLPKEVLTALEGKSVIQENEPMPIAEVIQFITSEATARGGTISPTVAQYLTVRVGNDAWQLSHEIDKLVALAQGSPVTKEHVTAVTDAMVDDKVFDLIDAIATQNASRALQLLERQFAMSENPFGLLTLITRQFRILYQIANLLQSDPKTTDTSIATVLKIHPFVAKKSLQQARNFPIATLTNIYPRLLELDVALKSGNVTPQLLLEYFIVTQKLPA